MSRPHSHRGDGPSGRGPRTARTPRRAATPITLDHLDQVLTGEGFAPSPALAPDLSLPRPRWTAADEQIMREADRWFRSANARAALDWLECRALSQHLGRLSWPAWVFLLKSARGRHAERLDGMIEDAE